MAGAEHGRITQFHLGNSLCILDLAKTYGQTANRYGWQASSGSAGSMLLLLRTVVPSRSQCEIAPSVREQFTALHPVLRVALSTIILVDSDLVVTSTRRALGDYRGMGLPEYAASLHLPQWDGWVHAVDLRTRGRSATQNSLMAFYFRAMGFRTLRHRGTADHLHVSLGMQQDSLAPYAPRTGT